MSLGDSFSSAEGLAGATGPCARSDEAFAPRARRLVDGTIEIATFVHRACSGARIADLAEQVEEASSLSHDEFNLVTLTIGGNDAGFGLVLADCTGIDDFPDLFVEGIDGIGCDLADADFVTRAGVLAGDLIAVYQELVDGLQPGGAVVVVGYPNLHADPSTWEPDRRQCEGISADDVRLLRRVATTLDQAVAAAAARVEGVVYVPVLDLFDGHELCGTGDPWLHGLSLGISARTFRPESSYHPNADGHRALAELLAETLTGIYEG